MREEQLPLSAWLPITRKEMENRGWDYLDIVLVSGDAYVDHPSFGIAVLGRVLESQGYKVGIIPQPNWQDDGRDFKKFGKPRLFFGVSAGSMDSMVNHYTANKRLRSDDAYTPGGKAGFRPDFPTLVYSKILKEIYPDVPVVVGGIEASLRRLTHYDYWSDKLKPSILADSKADILIYGMGEKPILDLAKAFENRLAQGEKSMLNEEVSSIPSLVYISDKEPEKISFKGQLGYDAQDVFLSSYQACLKSKKLQAANFKVIEEESNKIQCQRIIQKTGARFVVVNPPNLPYSQDFLDSIYDLPYTRLPHPKYKNRGEISAYTMIRHSVNIHRGCFGGCAFCTISAHQGKQIQSRSEKSVLKEVEKVTKMEDFKGYISDLGGPSANMYQLQGKDKSLCLNCKKPSCIFPTHCKNLNTNHKPMLDLYEKARGIRGVKKCFIGSGIRYDLLTPYLGETSSFGKNKGEKFTDVSPKDYGFHREYAEYVIVNCVSGRLKVAPEHTESGVLNLMRKAEFKGFEEFKRFFDATCQKAGMNQQLIPYFISSHPNCRLQDMKNLAEKTRRLGYKLEQVQDFTPTPMTLATEIYYTGINPYTQEEVYSAKSSEDRRAQNDCFFWYKRK